MGLRITEKMPKQPRGGTMFLLNTSTFNHEGNADGYMWTGMCIYFNYHYNSVQGVK